jgi:putative transposase
MKANDESAIDPVEKAGLATKALPGGFRRGKGRGRQRVLGMDGQANSFHVMSRTVGGEHLFGEMEKEAFVRVMRRLERFAGVEVMTYAVMANHFHLLVRVPDRAKFLRRFEGEGGEAKLLRHLSLLYSKGYVNALRHELSDLRSKGMKKAAEDLLERFRSRFCDLPHFVKELKERFSRWFNKHHGRKGTLWMDRYKSVLVQDGKLSLGELLRCRVRYFSDGVAIGSQSFVDGVFSEWRGQFGERRKDGARTLNESDVGLFSLRALRVRAVE